MENLLIAIDLDANGFDPNRKALTGKGKPDAAGDKTPAGGAAQAANTTTITVAAGTAMSPVNG